MPRLSKLIEKIEDRLANKWGCWYERNKARVPLYACKYYMAKGHWQIYCHYDSGRSRCGLVDTIPIYQVPRVVLDTADKAANLIGKGLYGVDLKMVDDKAYVIEINDNPSIDHGLEDAIIGDEMYYRLLNHFEQALEAKHY